MIPTSGLPSITGLKLVEQTRDTQLDLIRNSAQHKRAIEHFKANIKDVETVDQLLEDQELYAFVMRAFDLEDQIFGKAMIEKVLKSNIEENDALVNRLTDPRFREMYNELGFGTDGEGNLNTILNTWQNRMVDRYVERQFINFTEEQNETVGIALEFRNKVGDINSVFDILKDNQMTRFFQTALGLPSQMSGIDIDKQAELLESKIDLDTLSDPEVVDKLVRKYVAISDALSGTSTQSNGALQMLTGNSGNAAASIIEITMNIDPVSYSASRFYF
ncbi:hypothetical protein OB2597_20146 [Pseudooceanicola batsensis HTCC2597]|uniref:Flagellar basal-body rod protein FlgF n=1 Tax=Pseudooceanicola batsensis (strain ATCC BAA-863 / DSM 15984 / KCTC 12145 / HTCC2597) TaxID=252305 RepID=A3U0Y9_PSEBH|nr:DUF1217 domain-containing protein [Pseudooceanicola batsensis]EAQ01972.1 hypothetical protein OB2597_20146 [Pseudooceanicola batsensis HTCC2597]